MTFPRLVLWLCGLGFVAFGALFLLLPLTGFALTGMQVTGVGAATELRAFYGGLELGLGIFLVVCAISTARLVQVYALGLCVATFGGLALGRALGLILDGEFSAYLGGALAVEGVLASLAILALLRVRS